MLLCGVAIYSFVLLNNVPSKPDMLSHVKLFSVSYHIPRPADSTSCVSPKCILYCPYGSPLTEAFLT